MKNKPTAYAAVHVGKCNYRVFRKKQRGAVKLSSRNSPTKFP